MSDENWSEFKGNANGSFASENVSAGAVSADEADEFGGFEAAEDTSLVSNQVPETPSHWLLLAANAEKATTPHAVDSSAAIDDANAVSLGQAELCTLSDESAIALDLGSRSSTTASTGSATDEHPPPSQPNAIASATLRHEAELATRLEDAERRATEQRLQLHQQQERYSQLQARHENDIEELRHANQSALALIIEEYKELLKVSVLKQQELCLADFQLGLKGQMVALQTMCEEQRQAFELTRVETSRKHDGELHQALGRLHDELTAKHERALVDQKLHLEDKAAQAANEERDRTERAVTSALDAERERWRVLILELRSEFDAMLRTLKDEHLAAVKTDVEAERESSKSFWSVWVEDSKQSSRQAAKDAVEAAKQDFELYLDQRRKADRCVLHKSLATADLLIESARQQLKMMTSKESQLPEAAVGSDADHTGFG